MQLLDYLAILRRRAWIIALTTGVTLVVAFVGTWLMTPRYEASAILRLATATSGSISSVDFEVGYAERLMNTYVEIAESRPIRLALLDAFDLNTLPTTQGQIIADTELLAVAVEDTDPRRAADLADALAALLIETSLEQPEGGSASAASILKERVDLAEEEMNQAQRDLEALPTLDPNDSRLLTARRFFELKQDIYLNLLSQYELVRAREALQANVLTLIQPAVPPVRPSSPDLFLNLALALILGLTGGVLLTFVLARLDTTIYTASEASALMSLPVVGQIPTAEDSVDSRILKNGLSPVGDAFRRLHLNLASGSAKEPRTILVTSAVPHEGKTTVAANLGLTMSSQGRRVLLIDVDRLMPRLHEVFEVANDIGLSQVLTGEMVLDDAVRSVDDKLALLCSGPLLADPPKGLASSRMRQLLAEASDDFETIILDGPAFLSVSDAAALVPSADFVLLIVACRSSKRPAVMEVREQLTLAGASGISLVVNHAALHGSVYDYYAEHGRRQRQNGKQGKQK